MAAVVRAWDQCRACLCPLYRDGCALCWTCRAAGLRALHALACIGMASAVVQLAVGYTGSSAPLERIIAALCGVDAVRQIRRRRERVAAERARLQGEEGYAAWHAARQAAAHRPRPFCRSPGCWCGSAPPPPPAPAEEPPSPEIRVGDYVAADRLEGPLRVDRQVTAPRGWVVTDRGGQIWHVAASEITRHYPAPRITLPGVGEVVPDALWESPTGYRRANAAGVGWYRAHAASVWAVRGRPYTDESGTLDGCSVRVWPPPGVEIP